MEYSMITASKPKGQTNLEAMSKDKDLPINVSLNRLFTSTINGPLKASFDRKAVKLRRRLRLCGFSCHAYGRMRKLSNIECVYLPARRATRHATLATQMLAMASLPRSATVDKSVR